MRITPYYYFQNWTFGLSPKLTVGVIHKVVYQQGAATTQRNHCRAPVTPPSNIVLGINIYGINLFFRLHVFVLFTRRYKLLQIQYIMVHYLYYLLYLSVHLSNANTNVYSTLPNK